MRTPWAMALLTVTIILLSGCTNKSIGTEFRDDADAALLQFMTELGPEGTVTHMTGSLTTPGAEEVGGTFEIELGLDAAFRVTLESPQFSMEVICEGNLVYFLVSNMSYAARGEDDACTSSEEIAVSGLLPQEAPLDEASFVKASLKGGVLEATYKMEDESGTVARFTIGVENGKVSSWRMEGDSGLGTNVVFQLDVTYGERRSIPFPDADTRLAAQASGEGVFEEGTYRWTVTEMEGTFPLSDFSVRVYDVSATEICGPANGDAEAPSALATFDPSDSAEQSDAGFTFTFTGGEDGQLGVGDAFTVSNPAWTAEGDYTVLMWDHWAESAMADECRTIPGPGMALLATGILVAFAVAGRLNRRRD